MRPKLARAANWLRRFAWRDLLVQTAIVVGGFQVYEYLRHLMPPDWPLAITNAHRVLHLEQALHLAWEQTLQRIFLGVPEVVEAMNVFYFVGHFILTGVFFTWLYFQSRDGFRSFRNAFIVSTAIALFIHWKFPTAPPRVSHVGLEDTLRQLSDIDIGRPGTASYSNPVAAVPSLHAGWAVAVAYGIWCYTKNRLARVLAILYPIAVVLTIVVTGNHFILDAIAGVAVTAFGFAVMGGLRAARPRRGERAVVQWGSRRGVEQSGSSPGS